MGLAARFLLSNSFAIRSRHCCVFTGDIIEGEISDEVQIFIHFNSMLSRDLTIKSVEFTDSITRKESKLGLVVQCESEEELDLMLALEVSGEAVEITSKARFG